MTEIKKLGQEEAQRLDQELFNEYGYSVDQLMELAGLSCAVTAARLCMDGPKRTLILAGPGNNGGDGLVAARHLVQYGHQVDVIYPKEGKSELFGRLIKQCEGSDVKVSRESKLPDNWYRNYGVVMDAVFGFSFKGEPREPFASLLKAVYEAPVDLRPRILAVDVPSAWNVEDGPTGMAKHWMPDALISLTAPKRCSVHFTGQHFLGGRFVPPKLNTKYGLNVPPYPNDDHVILLSGSQ
eukprot:Clim_evm33s108 gene=Clim_evmTU33s108